ncbi:MAG TPA: tetratricopeptide repeat protein [Polyangiaceae bacterium]
MHAPNQRERDEATYRMAASLERAGDYEAAAAAYRTLARGRGARAARATFALADLELARGDPGGSATLLRAAILRFPNFGPARGAAARLLKYIEKEQGQNAALAETERLARRLAASELAQFLEFERARRVQRAGHLSDARTLYLELARRYPYPRGVYWDDSLLAASRIDIHLGAYGAALAHLEALLAQRERARVSGSYERPAFAESRFLLGELHRDHLGDLGRARAEFRRVFEDHPSSRLGDDALFEEILIARRQQDYAGACEVARMLYRSRRESRFSACLPLLCSELSDTTGTCPTYLKRAIDRAAAPPQDYSSSSR